jgi:hypothetical protein
MKATSRGRSVRDDLLRHSGVGRHAHHLGGIGLTHHQQPEIGRCNSRRAASSVGIPLPLQLIRDEEQHDLSGLDAEHLARRGTPRPDRRLGTEFIGEKPLGIHPPPSPPGTP